MSRTRVTVPEDLRRPLLIALAAIAAILLAWRVVAAGIDAQRQRDDGVVVGAIRHPAGKPGADAPFRQRLARNPADASAMLALALELERQGNRDEADAAIRQALLLAPVELRTLLPAADYYFRSGKDREALAEIRRAADSSPADVPREVWDVLVVALDSGRHHPFFVDIARSDPPWWGSFFRLASARAANVAALESVLATRASGGIATADERDSMVTRLQRDGQWTKAYGIWLNGLPREQQQRIGYVFNGGFEYPLAKRGFGWLVPAQPGVAVSVESKEGMTGNRVLQVAFANTRFAGPPVYQYLLLFPGHYQFDGRARADLRTWLGLQWSVYCEDGGGRAARQLFHTEPLARLADWRTLRAEFVVPDDCPAQVLRLELASPTNEAKAPDAVPVRLNGRAWFDDLRVRLLDAPQGG